MNGRQETKAARKVRSHVSKAYADAVSKRSGGCCREKAAAPPAGYGEEDLKALPPGLGATSFGSGSPLPYAAVREGQTVLDLGCGAGLDLLLAGRTVGPSGRAIGVDMTDAMVARAKENVAAAGVDHVEVRKGLIEELPVDSGSVDWVISNCVINLSPEKHQVFAEIARVLKPGGEVLISDIVVADLPGWMREHEDLLAACVAGAISEEAYLDGLRGAGLAAVEVRDRHVFDAAAIAAFLASGELPAVFGGADEIEALAESLAGKVWSAKFYARKPGTAS